MTDDLLQLGDLLEKRIARFQRLRSNTRWSDEKLSKELERFAPLEKRILTTPANSLPGLVVKARTILWRHGCTTVDEMISDEGTMSILQDILAMQCASNIRSEMIGSVAGTPCLT